MAQLSVGQEEMLRKEASWLTVLQEARGRRKARKMCCLCRLHLDLKSVWI